MPIEAHDSFNRPSVSVPLWRYMDIPKFIDLLTSQKLWLSNLQSLAASDPYEGSPWPVTFPHRMWRKISDVPESLRTQILSFGGHDSSPEERFHHWLMLEEQVCLFEQAGRRQFYINCWHAAAHESAAMWKIYGAPGDGIAIISNGARLESALASNPERLHLGAVQYVDPDVFVIGTRNSFEPVLVKGAPYRYEHEVRLIYWDTTDMHDPLQNFDWNSETMRFENVIEDSRPVNPGVLLSCDVSVLIDRVIISPFAPSWYLPMIERLRDQLDLKFTVSISKLLTAPQQIP
jgi:hypothetical protein